MGNLASTYQKQERRKKAEKLQTEVKEKKGVIGEKRSDMLTSIINRPSIWKAQDRMERLSN